MRWYKYNTNPVGTREDKICMSWFPTRLRLNSRNEWIYVWLEFYWSVREYNGCSWREIDRYTNNCHYDRDWHDNVYVKNKYFQNN